jgi:hypothetical protein
MMLRHSTLHGSHSRHVGSCCVAALCCTANWQRGLQLTGQHWHVDDATLHACDRHRVPPPP